MRSVVNKHVELFSVCLWISFCFCVVGMDQVRTAVGLGSLDGRLYAVGGECEATGHEGTLYLKSVECFDPRTNCWSRIPDMQFARSFAAVSSFNGKPAYDNVVVLKQGFINV